MRCGRAKRDSSGNESGETSWLARRVGLLPEGAVQLKNGQSFTLDSDKVGGWGIRIVKRLSDEVRYDRINGRNRLTLVFHPRPPAVA